MSEVNNFNISINNNNYKKTIKVNIEYDQAINFINNSSHSIECKIYLTKLLNSYSSNAINFFVKNIDKYVRNFSKIKNKNKL